jgi:hypothetical protein
MVEDWQLRLEQSFTPMLRLLDLSAQSSRKSRKRMLDAKNQLGITEKNAKKCADRLEASQLRRIYESYPIETV